MDDFETKGYRVLRGKLSPETIEKGRGCIQKTAVNYTRMTGFIESDMLTTISKEMGPGWNIQYSKYRVSNNNNSDASTFHRDNVCLNDWVPVITCLTYLDKTIMEVIPGSHRVKAASYWEAPGQFAKRERLELEPGDLLIFYGTMLHRGILTDTNGQRRLIQVFECFKNPEVFETYSKRLIHVTGDEKSASGFAMVSKIPGARSASNTASFLNMITGCGNTSSLYVLDKCGLKGTSRDVFCSEGFCKRIDVQPDTWQEINTYIINDRNHFDLPETCKADWKWALYNRQFTIYFMIIAALLVAALTGLYMFARSLLKSGRGKIFTRRRPLRGGERR